MSLWLKSALPTGAVDEALLRTVAGAALLVFGGVAAVLTWVGPGGGFGGLWVTLALQLVPGAAVGLLLRLRGIALTMSAVLGSLSVLILVALPMAWFGWWHVRPVATALLVATSGLGAVVASGELRAIDHRAGFEIARRVRLWTFGPGGVATIGFALVLASAKHGLPHAWGAFVAAGPLGWLGLTLIAGAVVWAFGGGGGISWAVTLLTCVVPSLQAASYGLPTVQVAARHVGIAESIIATGHVYPSTDIYQAWSGLFASAAFVKVASGWSDLLLYATVWGAVASAMMALAVRVVAGYFHGQERAWSAALIFGLGSSLNTSFFAPQMFGFVASMVVIALILHLNEPRTDRRLATYGIAVLSVATAVTHQLSPYLAFLAVAVLTVTRVVKRWLAGAWLLVPAVLFALVNRKVLGPFISQRDLGQFLENLRPPTHAESTALDTALINRVTFDVPAAALVAIGLAAVFVLWRHRHRQYVALALAAMSPGALFFGSSYGNEGVFRVALFALPWLSILAAFLLPEPGRRFWTLRFHPGRTAAVLLLSLVQAIGCTGMDYSRVERPANLAAITWIEQTVPKDSYVFMLGTDLAEPVFVTGRLLPYISRETLFQNTGEPAYPTVSGAAYDPVADLALLTATWSVQPAKHIYVLATDSMAIFDERYGQQTIADENRLEAQLRATTASWKVVYEVPGARVYEFLGVVP